MVTVPVAALTSYLERAFRAYGATEDEVREVTVHLIEASLTGHDSHGALRAPWYMEKIELDELHPGASITVHNETPTTAIVDGGWGFGQPASRKAMEIAIAKAEQSGLGCVTVRNANHMGRVGLYTSLAADSGMIGMGCVNLHGASPCVAPFGGIDRRLPTNPFSVAFPTGREPHFLMDMTTSVVAEGKLQLRRNKGMPAEPGWIIDHDGAPTTDPRKFYNDPVGCLLTVGGMVGYKGFALSLAIEGLAGGLSGAGCSRPDLERHGNACWYMAIRIDCFQPLDAFIDNVQRMIAHMKSSRRAEGVDEILIPGEPEYRTRQDRLAAGIPLDDVTWKWFRDMTDKVGVSYDGPVAE